MLKKILAYLLMMILIFAVTYFVNYDMGNLGYISLSDGIIMVLAKYFIPSYGMLVAGIPCVICDFLLGCRQYALFTFVIKAAEAYFVSFFLEKKKKFTSVTFVAGIILVIVMVLVDLYLYGNVILQVSIIKNSVQILLSLLLADTVNYFLEKIRK